MGHCHDIVMNFTEIFTRLTKNEQILVFTILPHSWRLQLMKFNINILRTKTDIKRLALESNSTDNPGDKIL